jgi:hypothetical protein
VPCSGAERRGKALDEVSAAFPATKSPGTSDSVVSGDLQEGNQVCVILEGKTLSAQESAIIPWWSGWHSIRLYNFRKP